MTRERRNMLNLFHKYKQINISTVKDFNQLEKETHEKTDFYDKILKYGVARQSLNEDMR